MIVRTLQKMGSRLDIDHGALWHGPPFSMACLSSTICCCNPRVFAALRRRKIFRSTEPSSRNIVGKIRCAESAAMPLTSSRPSQPSEPQGLRDCLGSVSLGSAMARVTETSETSCPLPLGVSQKRNCTRLRFAEGGNLVDASALVASVSKSSIEAFPPGDSVGDKWTESSRPWETCEMFSMLWRSGVRSRFCILA